MTSTIKMDKTATVETGWASISPIIKGLTLLITGSMRPKLYQATLPV
jgi:hypothetical protein